MSGDKVQKVDTSKYKSIADSTKATRYVQNGKRADGSNICQESIFGDSSEEKILNAGFVLLPVLGAGKAVKNHTKQKKSGRIHTGGKFGIRDGLVRRQANQLEQVMNEKAPAPKNQLKGRAKRARQALLQNRDNRYAWSLLTKSKNVREYENNLNLLKQADPKSLENVLTYLKRNEPNVDLQETALRKGQMQRTISLHEKALQKGKVDKVTLNRLNNKTKNIASIGKTNPNLSSMSKSLRKLKGKSAKGFIVGAIVTLGISAIQGAISSAEKRKEIRSLNLSEGKEKELIKKSNGKEWTKTAIDAAGIGVGIAAGAGIGAAIGTVVPGIGNVIGGIIGGIAGGILSCVGMWGANHINNKMNYTRKSAIENYEEELTNKFASGKMTKDELHDFNELQKHKNKMYLNGQINFTSEEQAEKFQENMIKTNKALIALGEDPIPNQDELDLIDDYGNNITDEYRKQALKQVNKENKEHNTQLKNKYKEMTDEELKSELSKAGIKLDGKFTRKKATKALYANQSKPTNPWFNPFGWFNNSKLQSEVAKMPVNEIYTKAGAETEYKAMVLGINKEEIIEEYKAQAQKDGKELTNEELAELENEIDQEINDTYNNEDVKKTTHEMNKARLTMNDEEYETWSANKIEEELNSQTTEPASNNGGTTASGNGTETAEELGDYPSPSNESATQQEEKEEVYISPFELGFDGKWDNGAASKISSEYNFWNGFAGNIPYQNNFMSAFGDNFGYGMGQSFTNTGNIWQYSQPFSAFQYDNGYIPQTNYLSMNSFPWMMYNNGNNGQTKA